jgi:hypothetical protein
MKIENFLLKDYELKIQYLTNHFSRMWTRFHFLLTINSALLVFYVNTDALAFDPQFVIITGTILSVLWYCFGATDNYLVEVYRKQVGYAYELLKETALAEEGCFKNLGSGLKELEKRVQCKGGESEGEESETYSYVGDVKEESFDPETKAVEPIHKCFLQWRIKSLRQ